MTVIKYIRRVSADLATHIYDVPPRMLASLILILMAATPFIGILELRRLDILTHINLVAILAVSWDLLVGRTGQISLGHALFYGIGAYTTAILYQYFAWPVWITVPISAIAGFCIAILIGIPCLRFKGPYLALITMAFPLAIVGFLYYYRDIFGGETGIPRPLPGLPRIFDKLLPSQRIIANYYFSLALLTISSVIIYKIATSKTGIVFVSILDDELGSKACGINTSKYKLLSFAISGLFGSLAGAVMAHTIQTNANPRYFFEKTALIPTEYSIVPIIAAILGGLGTIYGPIIGVYIYYLLNNYIFEYLIPVDKPIKIAIFVSIIIILIIKWPRGIARTIVEKLEDLEEPREVEEILKERMRKNKPEV
ncbi:MAG: branched-chain amino acid ABC transporter permease [Candidatus Bathyarchaeia archaeon]